MKTMDDAACVFLHLDHVKVECSERGAVIVKCWDHETSTLSMWVMRRSDDGWSIDASTVPVDVSGSLAIN